MHNYDYGTKTNVNVSASLPLGTIGFITWLVFLILKLCNQGNPNFEWLTWFWVWFPFWMPFALFGVYLIIVAIIVLVLTIIDNYNS